MSALADMNLTPKQIAEFAHLFTTREGARAYWWANPEKSDAKSRCEEYRSGAWVEVPWESP